MSDDSLPSLSVSIQDLTVVHVACLEYRPGADRASMHTEIRACFDRVKAWAREHGHDPYSRTIGVIHVADGELASYDCCIQVPGEVQNGSDGVDVKDLVGGRYAVLCMPKGPAVIGPSIGRFYQEYVPRNSLSLDGSRPTYEIYCESTMEYCVPIL